MQLLLLVLVSFEASATSEYFLTAIGQTSLAQDKVTHVVVVGSAMKEDSDQFFQTGLLHAYKYKDMYPAHQVVVMAAPDVVSTDNEDVFAKFNLPIIKKVEETFTAGRLVNEMLFFSKIASFDFYGHSSPWAVKLAKKDGTIEPSGHQSVLEKLLPRFTENAYATLNGCNGGFELAPKLAKIWKIPVSGSLTSTQFERLQTDGWYKKTDRTETDYAPENHLTYSDVKDCSEGVCWRLKTARKNYSSYWGKFESGLSFPKFFCDGSDKCKKIMAHSLLSFPSVRVIKKNSTEAEFKEVLFDYLCSTAKDKNYFKSCVDGINNAVSNSTTTFQMHPGNALNCDFDKCDVSIKCKKKIFGSGPRAGSCKTIAEPNTNPTTLVREYQAFLRGFKLLN